MCLFLINVFILNKPGRNLVSNNYISIIYNILIEYIYNYSSIL